MGRTNTYDVVVIGCGAMGSAAAYHLARAGKHVLLVEQFELGHTRGSSHGGSRIIRYTHDSIELARHMPETFELWRQLERESGANLLEITGGIYAGSTANPFVEDCRRTLEELNFSYTESDGASMASTFPQFHFPDDWRVLFQSESGILAASRCVETMAAQAAKYGATIRDHTRVEKVSPCKHSVELLVASKAGNESVYADQCIITAGAWINRLLAQIHTTPVPVRVTHQQVAYFPVEDETAFSPGRFPIFIIDAEPHFYGFPTFERAGHIKVAVEQSQRVVDPDAERAIDHNMVNQLGQLITQFLPTVTSTPVHVEPCIYTETANRDFVIDRIPDSPQIIVGGGFSGRGFKHAVAIGKLLSELAQSDPGVYNSPFWLDNYRITRFAD